LYNYDFIFQRFCNLRGWSGDSEKVEKTRSCLLKVWDGLQSGADKDQDGQVRKIHSILANFTITLKIFLIVTVLCKKYIM